ncbi:hypothetical protein TSMG0090 [Halocynthia phage JM-2012]|uniref:hypothetical protein n=1 Tax=Halocynthia phage JM-2012 TaxID=1173297 RepID=UPI00025C692E|nr:hypothetical protein TSMG0090 [Halocynthia phage JM-2012]AFI55373.1 hypothetical protein TSMG0090 [Halocynthia phage JM-2012]
MSKINQLKNQTLTSRCKPNYSGNIKRMFLGTLNSNTVYGTLITNELISLLKSTVEKEDIDGVFVDNTVKLNTASEFDVVNRFKVLEVVCHFKDVYIDVMIDNSSHRELITNPDFINKLALVTVNEAKKVENTVVNVPKKLLRIDIHVYSKEVLEGIKEAQGEH